MLAVIYFQIFNFKFTHLYNKLSVENIFVLIHNILEKIKYLTDNNKNNIHNNYNNTFINM